MRSISIHALLAESDIRTTILEEVIPYFYPRSPCGERHFSSSIKCAICNFYPRSPCGERPFFLFTVYSMFVYFYPRSPCGERRACIHACVVGAPISIHALLAESDGRHRGNDGSPVHFYPRSPCGERLAALHDIFKLLTFLSTLSLRRATTLAYVS